MPMILTRWARILGVVGVFLGGVAVDGMSVPGVRARCPDL